MMSFKGHWFRVPIMEGSSVVIEGEIIEDSPPYFMAYITKGIVGLPVGCRKVFHLDFLIGGTLYPSNLDMALERNP
jgi:hypothetical protein